MSCILVVDDEPAIGWSLREMLAEEGHEVVVAANAGDAVAAAARARPDAILLDVRLPGRDGIDAIPDLRRVVAAAPIVVMTAFGDLQTAVRAVRAGAFDYLVKPFDLERVSAVVVRALAAQGSGAGEGDANASPALVGSSPAMQDVFRRIAVVAAGDAPVLVTGPRGSGKRLVARAIHDHGGRRAGPFVATNLDALAAGAIGGELGGSSDAPGLIRLAHGGTLFIQQLEAAAPDVQMRLVRFLETGVLSDGPSAEAFDVRIIVSSRRDPTSLGIVEPLAERLQALTVSLSPLAERQGDVEPLVRTFLERHAAVTGGRMPAVTPGFFQALQSRSWPGNVRELKAAVEHAAVVARGGPLGPEHLPAVAEAPETPLDEAGRRVDAAVRDWAAAARAAFGRLAEPDLHDRTVRLVEATLLREALAHTGGNRTAAAKLLGLDRATLRTKLRHLGLDD